MLKTRDAQAVIDQYCEHWRTLNAEGMKDLFVWRSVINFPGYDPINDYYEILEYHPVTFDYIRGIPIEGTIVTQQNCGIDEKTGYQVYQVDVFTANRELIYSHKVYLQYSLIERIDVLEYHDEELEELYGSNQENDNQLSNTPS